MKFNVFINCKDFFFFFLEKWNLNTHFVVLFQNDVNICHTAYDAKTLIWLLMSFEQISDLNSQVNDLRGKL
jgi:hypothetical protein